VWLETKAGAGDRGLADHDRSGRRGGSATAYLVDHGLGGWESVLGGGLIFLVVAVAALCACLTVYRLVAIWVCERRHAEVAYWLARRDAEEQVRVLSEEA
jgi:hypothetical protein